MRSGATAVSGTLVTSVTTTECSDGTNHVARRGELLHRLPGRAARPRAGRRARSAAGWPSARDAASSASSPAGISRTRCTSRSNRNATSAAEPLVRNPSARRRLYGSSVSPTSRRSDAALPPTATAVSRAAGRSAPAGRSTRSLTASSSASVGGSLAKWASARNPDPTLNDFHHSTPPAIVPMAISLEPPPTSTTAIRPSSGCPSVRVAPRKARRASSSPSSTHTSTPPWRSISAQNSSRFAALRMTAVATVRIAAAPA